MKIENFDIAQRKIKNLRTGLNALADIKRYLETGVVDAGEAPIPFKTPCLHSLHIAEYHDGSGNICDLTGVGVGVELLHAMIPIIERRIAVIQQEIERL